MDQQFTTGLHKRLLLLIGGVIAILLIFITMNLFKTNILFSAVTGNIVMDGKPVEGAEVTQTTLWSKPNEVPDTTVTTDASGQFVFPEIVRSASLFDLLPGEITIVQEISIVFNGKTYRGWLNTKTNFMREGERNKPLQFICDLNHTPSNTGDDFGVCHLK